MGLGQIPRVTVSNLTLESQQAITYRQVLSGDDRTERMVNVTEFYYKLLIPGRETFRGRVRRVNNQGT